MSFVLVSQAVLSVKTCLVHTDEIFRNPERHQFLCQAKQQHNYAVKCARSVRWYILMAVVTVVTVMTFKVSFICTFNLL